MTAGFSELAPMDVAGRIARLRERFGEAGVDGLLVTNLVNIRYLTGFSGSAGLLMIDESRAVLTTDGRYRIQAAQQLEEAGVASAVKLVVGRLPQQHEALLRTACSMGSKNGARLGLEADHITWSAQRRWHDAFYETAQRPRRRRSVSLVSTTGLVESLREVKDPGELARIERACMIADAALGEVIDMIGGGASEAEVALSLDTAMRRLGAEDTAFETIVASGPNSALPHARPTPKKIQRGDPVVVDFGALFDGYRSDMTRTFFAGGKPRRRGLSSIYDAVAQAQAAGVAAVRGGVQAKDVDEACRSLLEQAGWAKHFEHSTGHGVGLDIHEAPAVAAGVKAKLRPATVVTVEPGVYVRGLGGVRIEDTVVVTGRGRRVLTGFPKDPSLS